MSEEIDYGLVYLKIRIDEVSFQSTLNVYSLKVEAILPENHLFIEI